MNTNEDSRKISAEKHEDARQMTDEQLNEVTGGAGLTSQHTGVAEYRCTKCGKTTEKLVTTKTEIPETLGRCPYSCTGEMKYVKKID